MADGGTTTMPELARARRSADIGDVSHTVLHSQEALYSALQRLTDEVGALRAELSAQRTRA